MREFLSVFLFVILCFPAMGATEIRDTEIETGLTALIAPVATAAGIPDGRVRIHIVADEEFNAFVSGGEDVYIYTGLLMRIKSPAALQAVIAHEMGHMIGGHMAQMSARMHSEMTRTLIMQALGVGLMAANPMAGAGVIAGSTGIAKQSVLAFTRDEERLADDTAVNLLVKADLDPASLLEVMEQMQEMTSAAEERTNPHDVNHPLTSERIQNIKEKIKGLKNNKEVPADSAQVAEYNLIRAKLAGYLQTEDQIKALYSPRNKSDDAVYARAIRFMRSGNLKIARAGAQKMIYRHSENPYFYELLGDIEYQFGHYDDSVKAYEKSLKISKNAPQIQTALALVLCERAKPGDTDRAIELAKRSILIEPMPLSYWVLVMAYGDDARADWARAEYYNMLKNKKEMKKYARAAQSRLTQDSPEYIKAGDLLK